MDYLWQYDLEFSWFSPHLCYILYRHRLCFTWRMVFVVMIMCHVYSWLLV